MICNEQKKTQESGQPLDDRMRLAVMMVTDPFVASFEKLLHELGVIDQLHDVAVEQHDATRPGVLLTP